MVREKRGEREARKTVAPYNLSSGSNYELFNSSSINIRYWCWNYGRERERERQMSVSFLVCSHNIPNFVLLFFIRRGGFFLSHRIQKMKKTLKKKKT